MGIEDRNKFREFILSINEQTVLSLNVVIMVIGAVIWLTRLNSRVDFYEMAQADLRKEVQSCVEKANANSNRLYRVEERLKIKHPPY